MDTNFTNQAAGVGVTDAGGQHAHASASATDRPPMKIAYNITERKGRSFWTPIGRAFINRDGSINVMLESFPVSGQLQLRNYEPRDDARPGGAGGGGGGESPGSGGDGPGVTRSRSSSSSGNRGPLTELPF